MFGVQIRQEWDDAATIAGFCRGLVKAEKQTMLRHGQLDLAANTLIIRLMAYDYDALYATQANALGKPSPAFVSFFATYNSVRARVLDIGCGQGRDAIFIAQAGHRVVGVDISKHGIAGMLQQAKAQKLDISGIVSDVITYEPEGQFDVILIDRTLHMLPDNAQSKVLAKLITHLQPQGWMLIADETSNLPRFREVFSKSGRKWSTHKDGKGLLFAQAS